MKRVLIIDDEDGHVRLFEHILAKETGYKIKGVTDPINGLKAAIADPPDLILMDIVMPGMTGWELLQRLEANEATWGIPVILISAFDPRKLEYLRLITNEAIWLSALWYGLQYHWLCDRQSVDVAEQSRHHLEDVLPQR